MRLFTHAESGQVTYTPLGLDITKHSRYILSTMLYTQKKNTLTGFLLGHVLVVVVPCMRTGGDLHTNLFFVFFATVCFHVSFLALSAQPHQCGDILLILADSNSGDLLLSNDGTKERILQLIYIKNIMPSDPHHTGHKPPRYISEFQPLVFRTFHHLGDSVLPL